MKNTFTLILFFAYVFMASAQDNTDLENSHDHPMITRMNNYLIGEFEQNYDRVEMQVSDEVFKDIDGNRTHLYYFFNEGSGGKHPSIFQIVKNHENAIKKLGGKTVYHDGQGTATFNVKKNGTDVWVKLVAANSGEVYYLTVVEVNKMDQEITAKELYQSITTEGSVALHINFETGKSTIKSDSQPIINQVAQMLMENTDLKLSIEGHTDNVGDAATNKTLSLNRARAVVQSLIAKGISATRLSTVGWGQEKPISDTETEEGRALNRRVEIVGK
jgi:outer membrane protein OmpA-like peptidoglycan-associated protein